MAALEYSKVRVRDVEDLLSSLAVYMRTFHGETFMPKARGRSCAVSGNLKTTAAAFGACSKSSAC